MRAKESPRDVLNFWSQLPQDTDIVIVLIKTKEQQTFNSFPGKTWWGVVYQVDYVYGIYKRM